MKKSIKYCEKDALSGVIPWWTINGHVVEEEALRQLDDFLDKGIRDFFIYPNFGLESPDFLSEEWFDFIGFIVEACKKRNMHLWLYDELNWPSGSAGGRLCRDYPQYRMQTLRRSEVMLEPGQIWKNDAAYDICHIYVWKEAAVPVELELSHVQEKGYCNESNTRQRMVILHKILIDDLFFCSMGTSGTWNQRGIFDALNPEAVRAWMSYNYEPYRLRFKEELGKTIRGFFFDEPTMVSPFHTGDIPWTPGIEDVFKDTYHYDGAPYYWVLFESSPGYEQFRYDYWSLLSKRFADSFAGQLSKWCEDNHLMLSGHCWPEEPSCQRLMLTATGDIHLLQQYLHIPGTDVLFCENSFEEKAGMCPNTPHWARNLIYSAKHPSSTARYNGARYTICECSGIVALRKTPAAPAIQKKMFDFLAAMGISIMNPARPYSMVDFRKHVCALDAGQSYWAYYGDFSAYLERLAQFNSRGRTKTRIAILNPLSTKFAFTDISADTSIRNEKTPLMKEGDCSEAMLASLDALVRGHRDFELIFEDVVCSSSISSSGELLAPNSAFNVIILPQCYALDVLVWKKLQDFSKQGGTLIAVGNAPVLPLKHRGQEFSVEPLPVIALNAESEDFSKKLLSVLAQYVQPDYTLSGDKQEEILSQLRQDASWQALFLSNGTPGEKTIEIMGSLAKQLHSIIDLQTGRVAPWSPEDKIYFKDWQSYLLTTDECAEPISIPSQELIIFSADWKIDGKVKNALRLKLSCWKDGQWQRISDTGVSDFIQDPDKTPVIVLQGDFTIQDAVPGDLRLWLDHAQILNLEVNGYKAIDCCKEHVIEHENMVFPIASYCKVGKNSLVATVELSPWLTAAKGIRVYFESLMKACEPMVLLGTFFVSDAYAITSKMGTLHQGRLEEQGLPQFADELCVSTRFDANVSLKNAFLELGECYLPITASLNGVALGTRLWQNGRLSIPNGVLKQKDNMLQLRLCGELWNLLVFRWGMEVEHLPFILPKVKLLGENDAG